MSETTMTTRRPQSMEAQRALRILAKSIYRELKTSGYGRTDVVMFTNEILDLVTGEMRTDGPADAE